ncbi:unnamed protein product, partial [Timema podura]|nr:unnamed protein product [Timema podura]
MMPNDKGEPTLAILDGPQINARANTLHKFKIYMFTKENKEGIEISVLNDDDLREAGFKPEVPTKVLTHGFSSTIHHPAVQDVKDGKQENRNRLFPNTRDTFLTLVISIEDHAIDMFYRYSRLDYPGW